jgi:2-phosphosulfolactate phosphatase
MKGTVIIDCFPESAERYRNGYAIVVVDVIRATTVATTAVSMGRRVFPAQTTDEAAQIAATLKDPLLVGELGGNMPYGFDITNSPVLVAQRKDCHRPMVLVSSSGTQLLLNAAGSEAVYLACLRNVSAVAQYINGRHKQIALLGAGSRGQFRREDQIGCAWVAEKLINSGYLPGTQKTSELVSRWHMVSADKIRGGKSAEYLRHSGQEQDLEFILNHIDDLDTVPFLCNGELTSVSNRIEARQPTSTRVSRNVDASDDQVQRRLDPLIR